MKEAIDGMLLESEIERITLEGSKAKYYGLTTILDEMEGCEVPPQIHILSPFDNLVIWRRRLQRLFDFDYSLECYRKANDRVYGYFCLPILWGDRFIGRLDSKADRKSSLFRLSNLAFEEDFEDYAESIPQLVERIVGYAHFNSCERVELGRVEPRHVGPIIEEELERVTR